MKFKLTLRTEASLHVEAKDEAALIEALGAASDSELVEMMGLPSVSHRIENPIEGREALAVVVDGAFFSPEDVP